MAKKGQNIYIKDKLEGPKHLHPTTFETLRYLQQTMCGKGLFWQKLVKKEIAKQQNFAQFGHTGQS